MTKGASGVMAWYASVRGVSVSGVLVTCVYVHKVCLGSQDQGLVRRFTSHQGWFKVIGRSWSLWCVCGVDDDDA